MPSLPEAALLGIIQGLTEWLPVSSSGHLVLFQQLFDIEQPLMLDVALHAGSLVVILIFLRQAILSIVIAIWRRDFASEYGRLAMYLVIGTAPVALAGYFLHDIFEALFDNVLAVGVALLVTGFILLSTRYHEGRQDTGYRSSLLVGIAQAASLVPGLSRSGATISTGLLSGIRREKAFEFSLLLAIPAICGAIALESIDNASTDIESFPLIVGALISMAVGYFAVALLQKIVINRKLHVFSFYCWALGTTVILLATL